MSTREGHFLSSRVFATKSASAWTSVNCLPYSSELVSESRTDSFGGQIRAARSTYLTYSTTVWLSTFAVQQNLESPNTKVLVSMLTRVRTFISAYLSTKETRSISIIVPAGVSLPIFASLKSTFVILDFSCSLSRVNHQTKFFHN